MPVDAEENKNGGYTVHDQRHEFHVVLDDPNAPLYRAKLSQRVLDELDSRNCLSLYVLDNREDGLPLMIYYTGSTSPYSVFRVSEPGGDRAVFCELNPQYYYYFGTHTSYAYGEE